MTAQHRLARIRIELCLVDPQSVLLYLTSGRIMTGQTYELEAYECSVAL